VKSLTALAARLPEEQHDAVVAEALKTARSIPDEKTRAQALAVLQSVVPYVLTLGG
jgi:hypothetical protein